jgi:hypothetical protein
MANLQGSIFINYRKDDSRWNALALYNELQKYFSKEQLFKDFNTILPGDDFVVSIENALKKCNVLLVVIGANWLTMKGEDGTRRLDDPDDFVRLEVATALSRNIQVIPVLIDTTVMPKAMDLPENMKSLSRRQFVEIDNTRFEDDVRKLAEAIKKVLEDEPTPEPERIDIIVDPDPMLNKNNNNNNNNNRNVTLPRPSNNMALAIVSIFLCLPFGIVSLISATKVDNLWAAKNYVEAIAQSNKAKSWAIYGFIAFGIFFFLYLIGVANQQTYEY